MKVLAEISDPQTFQGDPVFEMSPGEPVPGMRSGPFAVLVTPDLAEYFLTLNRVNRTPKIKRAQYANDMKQGLWRYPAEAIHFTEDGFLGNGQNRLRAVTWAGVAVWFRVEFGWPKTSLDAMDQSSPRNIGDVLRMHAIPDALTTAAMLTIVSRYDTTVGTARTWMNSREANFIPSAVHAEQMYEQDERAFHAAVKMGNLIHKALDNGLTRSVWAAAYYICVRQRPLDSEAFFGAVRDGGSPFPAVSALREHAIRRNLNEYRTGDRREALENILRAFQSYIRNEKPGFVRTPGFKLTAIRAA